uniref:Receptor protein-tyrosine kinase n=1 Tax=Amphimedon queenslandica TaxID=400682 RepID=A0A1X7U3B0_AMPQE
MSTNESYSQVKGHSSVFKMSNNESYIKKEDVRIPFYEPANNRIKIIAQIRKSKSVLIQFESLRLTSSLGSGQFGNVCKGQWKKPNRDTIDVAVKMLQDGASEQEKIKFLQEAAILSQFTHDNVIKLHGVVSDDEHPMIVIEYMSKGDLDHLLQKMITNPGELVHHDTPALLLSFCQQVCLGMTYLSSKGFVHRDLAARNILVSADNICKIIDFGLSRDLEDENYYVSHKGAIIPVKWTAPEALNYRKYSTASDVWSYGCLMYEIWSIGRKPYESDSNISALEKICSNERLPPPPGCPEAIYSLMISCWHPVASERPNFHKIMVSLLQPNKNILTIPESALSSHPQAGSLGGVLSCKVGDESFLYNVESNPGGKWFLSTLSPATCSGSFDDYNISFPTSGLNSGSTYNVTLAIWKKVGSNTYEKDSATIQHYTYTHSNNRRKKRATLDTTPFSPAVGIRKGSLIGAYLYTNANALPIIGRRRYSWFFIGACVSESPAATTTLTCNSGNFIERNVLHAEADVVKVDCGAPPSVLNATYSQLDNDTEYGARVQYNCSTGYNINGNDTISCLLNASWSSPTPSCSIVNCGNPGEPANGYTNDNVFTNFTSNSNQYNYGTTVSFNCNPGYGLVGVSTLTCTATGQWSNNIPLCIATTRSSSSSVNSATTLSTSSSVMPTTSVDGSNNLLVIGGVIGAMLLILLILIVAIPLIVLLVARSKRNSRELNDPATTNLINPITAPSEEHSTSDYDDPALTLKHESVPLLYSELESLKNEDDNKYPTEEVYDNENISNVVLPHPIYLDVCVSNKKI